MCSRWDGDSVRGRKEASAYFAREYKADSFRYGVRDIGASPTWLTGPHRTAYGLPERSGMVCKRPTRRRTLATTKGGMTCA
jgi:hypothetical protein